MVNNGNYKRDGYKLIIGSNNYSSLTNINAECGRCRWNIVNLRHWCTFVNNRDGQQCCRTVLNALSRQYETVLDCIFSLKKNGYLHLKLLIRCVTELRTGFGKSLIYPSHASLIELVVLLTKIGPVAFWLPLRTPLQIENWTKRFQTNVYLCIRSSTEHLKKKYMFNVMLITKSLSVYDLKYCAPPSCTTFHNCII